MTDYVHVTESCKQDNANCGQEDWSIRACNYLKKQGDIDSNDISLCANTYIVNGSVAGQTSNANTSTDSSPGNHDPNSNDSNFFIADGGTNEQTELNAWTNVKKFENGFKDIIKVIDNTYDVSHSHADGADILPLGDFDHKHEGDVDINPVNFSTAGGMVTPHTHTVDGGAYPLNGIDRDNLVDTAPTSASSSKIHMFNNADDVTNWSFRDDHWKDIDIPSGSSFGSNVNTVNDAITELETLIENIKNITVKLKDDYNSSSIPACSENLGKATHGPCITDNNLSSKCLDENGQYGSCATLKTAQYEKYKTNINSAQAAKLSAKNQTMLYNINVSATVNLAVGIAVLIYMIFKLFNLPNPAKKMGEVAGKVSDGAKKTAEKAKKNVGKAASVAKDGATAATKKTADAAKKGMGKIDNLTDVVKGPIKK